MRQPFPLICLSVRLRAPQELEEQHAKEGLPPGGVLTPATAFGSVLVDRLRGAGFTFEIEGAPAAASSAAAAK